MAHHGPTPFDHLDETARKKVEEAFQKAEFNKALDEAAVKQAFGDTGRYPQGSLNNDDEGEIRFGVAVTGNKKVMINFGKPVAWIATDPDQAQELGMLLIRKAAEARGQPVTIRIGADDQ